VFLSKLLLLTDGLIIEFPFDICDAYISCVKTMRFESILWWPQPLLIEKGIDIDYAATEDNIEFTHAEFDCDYLVH
jgi:hypothetical protein